MCKPATPTAEVPIKQFIAYELKSDSIGNIDGVTIYDGGYSALTFDDKGRLFTLNDRGPNLEAINYAGKPAKRFPIPTYSPGLTQIQFDSNGTRLLRDPSFHTSTGEIFVGLPIPIEDKNLTVELALDENFKILKDSPLGIDSEGLILTDSIAYVSDEYAPSILEFDLAGLIYKSRYSPLPSATSVKLPKWLLERQPNLGFEGLAYADGYLYAALQGPLSPPGGDPQTPLVRILRINTATGEIRHFLYALDSYQRKIGDMAMHPNGKLLVLEHGHNKRGNWSTEIYAISLAQLSFSAKGTFPPERFSDVATALSGGEVVSSKSLFLDLLAAGYPSTLSKPEGLAVDKNGKLYIINDNDYGIDSPNGDGKAVATGMKSFLFTLEE
jgi:hypothetical protein